MQSHKDSYVLSDENAVFKLAVLSALGDRQDQQDSAGYELKNTEGIVCVCDGMGGHEGGKTASTLAVDVLLNTYSEEYPCYDLHGLLVDSASLADKKIASLKNQNGELLKGGSTLTAISIREKELFWVSVGDSRIYLFRENDFVRVTGDHIYKYVLEGQLDSGQITRNEYDTEMEKGEALVSFLGNGIPYIDSNDKAFILKSGDKIMMMSDGLYKVLSDGEISSIVSNFKDIEEALGALEYKVGKVAAKNQISRDNITVSLIHIK